MGQNITIDVSPAGSIKVDATGFQGAGCEKATEQLEIVLGGGMAKKKKKPEYYNPPTTTQQGNKLTF